jgi:hypothetical protein
VLNIFLYITVVSRIETKQGSDSAACTTTDTSSVSTFNLTSPAKTLHHLAVLAIFDSLV